MFVNRQGVGSLAPADDFNRAYGLDAAWQTTTNGKVFAFLSELIRRKARVGPITRAGSRISMPTPPGTGVSRSPRWAITSTLRSGSCRGARPADRTRYSLNQPKQWPWIRRIAPHVSFNAYTDLDGKLETSRGHWHFFDIQHRSGARFGYLFETQQDRPRQPFTIYQDVTGRKVVISPGSMPGRLGSSKATRTPVRRSAPPYDRRSAILRRRPVRLATDDCHARWRQAAFRDRMEPRRHQVAGRQFHKRFRFRSRSTTLSRASPTCRD